MFKKILIVFSLVCLMNHAFSNWEAFRNSQEFKAFALYYEDLNEIYSKYYIPKLENDPVYSAFLTMQDISSDLMDLRHKSNLNEEMKRYGEDLASNIKYKQYVIYRENQDKFTEEIVETIKLNNSSDFSKFLNKSTYSSIISGETRPLKTVQTLIEGIAEALKR